MENDRHTWLIYALGGGWGHLNRAVALARVIARQRPVTVLTNSPYADRVEEWLKRRAEADHSNQYHSNQYHFGERHSKERHSKDETLHLSTPHPSTPHSSTPHLYKIANSDNVKATRNAVQDVLLQLHYDCLIVDTFPRGLAGELVEVLPELSNISCILIHRDLNPNYVSTKAISAFVQQWYGAVLVPGEGNDVPLAGLPNVIHTSPWLVCDADEIPSRTEIYQLLRIPQSVTDTSTSPQFTPLLLLCAAGQPSELEFFGNLTTCLTNAFPNAIVRCIAADCPPNCSPDLWVAHYPAMECLSVANVVIGGAGYNTVYECAALGVPLVSFAFPRLYDRQIRRANQNSYWVQHPCDAIATIQHLLNQTPKKLLSLEPKYINGAVSAAHHIDQIYLHRRRLP